MPASASNSFTHTTILDDSRENVYLWHSRKGALQRLLPPWQKVTSIHQQGGIAPGGKAVLKMQIGSVPFVWEAHHVEEHPGCMFKDIQAKGPFTHFSHTHTFTSMGEKTILKDHIEYALPGHRFLPRRLIKHVESEFQKMFRYRETILRNDLALHRKYSTQKLRILISGASGVLGRKLVPLLTTGGHEVYTLVRRPADPTNNEIFWDPESGAIDTQNLPKPDAVIHLAGEYIGLKRWTIEGQNRVLESRRRGTELLASTLAAMPNPPRVFLSASAIGYYGDCGDLPVTEYHPPGSGFVPRVCLEWEKGALQAEKAGIRTVLLRLGIGFTATGGALPHLLSTRPFGIFRRFGNGNQYFSWISAEDMVAAMLHCIATDSIAGPINIAAPAPVTNNELMRTLAETTSSRYLPAIPAAILRPLYGEMADELLLASCRISSSKLLESGFCFSFPDLRQTVAHELGILPATTTSENAV